MRIYSHGEGMPSKSALTNGFRTWLALDPIHHHLYTLHFTIMYFCNCYQCEQWIAFWHCEIVPNELDNFSWSLCGTAALPLWSFDEECCAWAMSVYPNDRFFIYLTDLLVLHTLGILIDFHNVFLLMAYLHSYNEPLCTICTMLNTCSSVGRSNLFCILELSKFQP